MDLRTLKSLERLEDLYGNLSAEQRNVFKARMSENGFDEQKYQQELRSRQQTVLQALGRLRGADAATAEATLSELNSLFYESADPAYRQHNEQVLAKTCHAFAALHAQTNAEQRSLRVAAAGAQHPRALQAFERINCATSALHLTPAPPRRRGIALQRENGVEARGRLRCNRRSHGRRRGLVRRAKTWCSRICFAGGPSLADAAERIDEHALRERLRRLSRA
jgi:hypothetical protein